MQETTGRSDRRDKRDHRRDERGDRKEDRGRGDRDAKRARIESTQGTLAEPPQNEVCSCANFHTPYGMLMPFPRLLGLSCFQAMTFV
eukprot:569047-Amphidinium_carterae.1